MKRSYKSQSGNVLFLILIAVALFAALSYAVTQSSRSGGGNASKEKVITDLAQIQQYASALRTAITRVMISNGCSDEQLNFESDAWFEPSDYVNPWALPNRKCDIFHSSAGGVAWQKPPSAVGIREYAITGGVGVWNIGLDTCDKTELMLITRVNREICIAADTQIGIPLSSGNPPPFLDGDISVPTPNAMSFGWQAAAGSPSNYGCGITLGEHGTNAPQYIGKSAGCYQSADSNYYYYEVLLPR